MKRIVLENENHTSNEGAGQQQQPQQQKQQDQHRQPDSGSRMPGVAPGRGILPQELMQILGPSIQVGACTGWFFSLFTYLYCLVTNHYRNSGIGLRGCCGYCPYINPDYIFSGIRSTVVYSWVQLLWSVVLIMMLCPWLALKYRV